jgi:type IV fimbrial biogenesis protein FimT
MEMSAAAARCSRAASRGFTALELMVTVAVLAVVLAVVAPSMSTFVASQRVKTSSFDVYSAMMFARSEAIKRRGTVEVRSATTDTDWSNGWTIVCPVPTCAADQTLRNQDGFKGVTITSTSSTLTYGLDGRVTAGDAMLAVQSQTNPDQAGRRCVSVDTTGLPRSRVLKGSATCS